MANPKYKTPRSKTRKRRSHLALAMPNLVPCEQCKQPKLMHHICKNCGSYKGEEIIKVDENAK